MLWCLAGLALVVGLTRSAQLLWSQPPTDRPQPQDQRDPRPGERPGGPQPRFGPPPEPLFDALDANRDGQISPQEMRNAAAALKKLDANGDGELSGEEVLPRIPGGPGMSFNRGGGPGRPGGPQRPERKLVEQFDQDGNQRLDLEERRAARKALKDQPQQPGRRFGPPGGFGRGGNREPAKPGARVATDQVDMFPDSTLYDRRVLRTFFLEFENDDWEAELADFKDTDVEVSAKLIVDGKVYPDVGVHFRGMSSFRAVQAGYKRSLNLSLNFVHDQQRLYGYRTINLLNCMGDPSMMSSALYSHLARQFIPAPQVNLAKLVINGESWGVYANAQQFNKDFLAENFGTTRGTRWKVSGSPRADGGLRYVGDDVAEYKSRFEIKSKDDPQAWKQLIALCRTLDETPTERLSQALEPILDVESLLWFLAFDVALVNRDGYWTRASDYSIFLDAGGKFYVLPHDMNETMRGARPGGGRPGGGRPGGERAGGERAGGERPQQAGAPRRGRSRFGGRGGGPRGGPGAHGGVDLDPLVGLDDPRMPLRSKVLAVPQYRQRYLQHVRTIAETALDWKTLGPVIAEYRDLIQADLEADTRKLSSFDEFLVTTSPDVPQGEQAQEASLRGFIERRQAFLLKHSEIVKVPRETVVPRRTPIAGSRVQPLTTVEDSAARIPLVINEVMADNVDTIQDPQGHYDDWIEVWNRGQQELDLSGMSLSDSPRQPAKWSFPPGTVLPAGGFLIIWADGDADADRGLHASFKLSKKGERLLLTAPQAKGGALMLVDQLEFGAQRPGISAGRSPKDSGKLVPLTPTPGKPNRLGE